MTTNTSAVVVEFDTHPARKAAERRSRELEEAMRRHPAFQSRTATPRLRLV